MSITSFIGFGARVQACFRSRVEDSESDARHMHSWCDFYSLIARLWHRSLNRKGRPERVCGEYWYSLTKEVGVNDTKIVEVEFESGYERDT